MKKLIVIAGVTGMVGRALAKACLDSDYEVTGIARNPQRARALFPDELQLLPWDEVVSGLHLQELEGAYAIINLVGENIGSKRWTRKRRQQILGSRIESVQQLGSVTCRLKSKPVLFLQASAVGYYGYELMIPADETGTSGSGFLAEVCRKLESEAGSLKDTRLVVMRFGVVLDAREGALAKILMPVRRFRVGAFPSPARNILSWIHIKDIASSVLHILEQPDPAPVYNLCAPESVIYRDFYTRIGILQKIILTIPVPLLLLKILLGADMVRETLQANQPVIPARLTEEGFSFAFPEPESALRDLLT